MADEPLSPEEELVRQFEAVSEALVHTVSTLEEARQFAGVVRLAIRNQENMMALAMVSAMIDRMDIILKEYKDVDDMELVDIVTEKMKNDQ